MLLDIGAKDLRALAERARERIAPAIYDTLAGGDDAGLTVLANQEAWAKIRLAPKILQGISGRPSLATTVLGAELSTPVLLAPAGLGGHQHPEGEVPVACAAEEVGTLFTLANTASCTVEEIAAAAPQCKRWFQFYPTRDRGWGAELLQRAAHAGFSAVIVTVDVRPGNMARASHVEGAVMFGHRKRPPMMGTSEFDASLGVDCIDWVRRATSLPVIIKGVLRPDDANRVAAAGANAVIVSNHGGRAMDTVVPTAVALPYVVDAVGHKVEVYADGGIRWGTDVLKALALGARAVFIGRPWVWGLVVAGGAGVAAVVNHLSDELIRVMTLNGAGALKDISPDLLWDHARKAWS